MPESLSQSRARDAIICLLAFLLLQVLLAASASLANEFPENADDPSAFTTVISARDYDDRFSSVADVLEQVAGVRVRRYGALGSYSTASIRGAKAEQTLVLIDGVRLNSAHRGSTDLSTLDLRGLERIEVIRGGGSARYGSDAVGGVISITTRRATDSSLAEVAIRRGELSTTGADLFVSRDREENSIAASYSQLHSENDFRFNRDLGLSLPFGGTSRHTRLNADFRQRNAFASWKRSLGPGTEFSLQGQMFGRDQGQPGNLSGAPVRSATDRQLSCVSAEASERQGFVRAALRRRPAGKGFSELSLSHRIVRGTLHDTAVPSCLAQTVGASATRVQSIQRQTSAEFRYAGRSGHIGPLGTRFRTSITTHYDQVRAEGTESLHRLTAHAFTQQELSWLDGRVRLVPALGFDVAESSSGSARSSQFSRFVDVSVDDDPIWLPRIGLILGISDSLRLKMNYQRVFRRPNFTELFEPDAVFIRGNPSLDSEDAWNFDIGLEYALAPPSVSLDWLERLTLQAVLFQRDVEESIEWLVVNNVYTPMNTGEAFVRGFELDGSASLIGGVEVSGSYTHVDSEIDATCTPLPHTPRNQLSFRGSLPVGPASVWAAWLYEDASRFANNALGCHSASGVSGLKSRQLDLGLTLKLDELVGGTPHTRGLSLSAEWGNLGEHERVDSLGLPLPDETLFTLTLRGYFR